MSTKALSNRVAVVAGATRGAGRGIARMLGAAGATVYCTGRSVRGRPATAGRPETIEETAEMVTAAGGRGVAVRTDHTVEDDVERLFQRVRTEQGRLDVLVNDVWGGDALTEWGSPFWELSIPRGQELLERAVHSHVITSRHGAPLMVERDAGLIVEVTDGDTHGYRGNLFYDLAKHAVIRLAYAMAADLHAHGVTALAITPGFLRSEAVLDSFGVTEANWRDAIEKDAYFAESETPCFVGRAIAALAADPPRRPQARRAVLELGIGEGIRLHRPGRTPARLDHLLSPQGAGDRRAGVAAGRDGRLRGSQPALPGRARPVSRRGSRATACLARPAAMIARVNVTGRSSDPSRLARTIVEPLRKGLTEQSLALLLVRDLRTPAGVDHGETPLSRANGGSRGGVRAGRR